MGDKKWAESGSQPDWLDVMASLRAVDSIHLGKTMVTMLPEGTGLHGGWRIVIATCWEALPGGTDDVIVTTERIWVGHRDGALPAFLLGGIYAHDYALGDHHMQKELPK